MARQGDGWQLKGTYDGLCFYEMEGQYYARQESSLTGKRVKRDPAFKRTMQLAGTFALVSAIASKVYQQLPKETRCRKVWYEVLRKVKVQVDAGKTREEVMEAMGQPKKDVVVKKVVVKRAVVKGLVVPIPIKLKRRKSYRIRRRQGLDKIFYESG